MISSHTECVPPAATRWRQDNADRMRLTIDAFRRYGNRPKVAHDTPRRPFPEAISGGPRRSRINSIRTYNRTGIGDAAAAPFRAQPVFDIVKLDIAGGSGTGRRRGERRPYDPIGNIAAITDTTI